MSENLGRGPSTEKMEPPTEKETPKHKNGKNKPSVFAGKEGPGNASDPNNRPKDPSHNWKERLETGFKILEALAFVAIILTFWEMRNTQIEDERAWIGISGAGLLNAYSADHIGLYFDIVNTGKTPAMIEKVDMLIGTSAAPFTNINWFFKTNLVGETIAPNGTLAIMMHEPNPIGKEGFALLNDKKRKDYFVVKILYKDVFKNVRHTDGGFIVTGTEKELRPGSIMTDFGQGRMD